MTAASDVQASSETAPDANTLDADVIGTGGCAFLSNALGTNGLTGDGLLLAVEAGAVFSGMEFTAQYGINIFHTSRDAGPKTAGFGAITVTDPFQTKYPEATQRVVRGLLRAAEWLSREENREEALQIWSKSGTPYAALKEEFEGHPLKQAYNPRIDEFLVEQYRDAIQFAKDEKLIRNDIDLKKWFEPKYLEIGLKDLGLERHWPRRAADGAAVN